MSLMIVVLRYSETPRHDRYVYMCTITKHLLSVFYCVYLLHMIKGCNFIVIVCCRFCDLSAVLEPGRPVRTDKPAILDDAIRVLSQLKTEAEELKESNEKLLEEIKCLKVSIFQLLMIVMTIVYFLSLFCSEMFASLATSFMKSPSMVLEKKLTFI